MTDNANIYTLDLEQCVNLIRAVAHETTVLVQGHMGSGKSSMLDTLHKMLPTHHAVYFDCTTKDLGDIMLPKLKDLNGADYVQFATNEELGLHLRDRPIILMIDEYGKANRSVQNALLRPMQERKMGGYTMHPDSLIFATTNLGSEGVGDMLQPHARNRIMVVEIRKPDSMSWIEWAINSGIEPIVMGWVRENPHCMQDFREVKDPEENPYIFHPRAVGRTSFVTPRSLHKASNLLKQRQHLDDVTVTAGLIGTIGTRAALDMMAFVKLADKLPTLKSIKEDPEGAKVPDNPSAQCMVIYRALASIERNWLDAWMVYLGRMPAEAQGMFALGVAAKGYSRQGMVMTHKGFTTWARQHSYLFAADI
jgi:energy-coupling factor transporter ATP-binding protein EcfA2